MKQPLLLRPLCRMLAALIACCPLLLGSSAAAAGAISQGFVTSDTVAPGSLMNLSAASKDTAELATSKQTDRLLGIVANKALVQLDSNTKVQIVTSGLTEALVSDINGPVATGDRITASPIKGVGMKATGSTAIVGTAQASLSSSTKITQESVKDKVGVAHTIQIAQIPVLVNVTYYRSTADQLAEHLPSFLQAWGNVVAGHPVSSLRVVTSFAALVSGFAAIGIMLYAAVRSGLIAIGRNPLAEAALRKGLFEIIVASLGILLLSVIVVYVILAA